jgi:hypothetical protein
LIVVFKRQAIRVSLSNQQRKQALSPGRFLQQRHQPAALGVVELVIRTSDLNAGRIKGN